MDKREPRAALGRRRLEACERDPSAFDCPAKIAESVKETNLALRKQWAKHNLVDRPVLGELPEITPARPTDDEIRVAAAEVLSAIGTALQYRGRGDLDALLHCTIESALRWAARATFVSKKELDAHERTQAAYSAALAHWRREATERKSIPWPERKPPMVHRELGITIWATEEFGAPTEKVREVLFESGPQNAAMAYAAEKTGCSMTTVQRRLGMRTLKIDQRGALLELDKKPRATKRARPRSK